MSNRTDYLKVAAESVAAGAAAGAVVNGTWYLATGSLPSLLTSLIAADIVTALWGAWRAMRFRRKWKAVLASYERPALGAGIDIPHRPPLGDDQQDGGER